MSCPSPSSVRTSPKSQVDAIVNAANTELEMGGGVCGAIFQAAGVTALRAACRKVAPIPHGGSSIPTPGFNLPAKYIIHAAGPVYRSWDAAQSERLLRSAYLESLRLARRHRCASIAFPLISSGIYGYPKEEALRVATAAMGISSCSMTWRSYLRHLRQSLLCDQPKAGRSSQKLY